MTHCSSVYFCGTPEFALPSLQALIHDPHFSVDVVITQPDKPVGRKKIITPPPVKLLAEQNDISIFQPKNINREFFLRFSQSDRRPDFLVVVAYGQILSQDILDFPSVMPVNVHASLLPHWRGASPIQHAILFGDTETGITIQKMVYALDAGPILAQETLPINDGETTLTLQDRLAHRGARLLIDTLKHLHNPQIQDETEASYCSKLTRADGRVDPSIMDALTIDRRVRALHPWPGVHCAIEGQTLKILQSSLVPTPDSSPLSCARHSTLHLMIVQIPGKKPVSGAAWARGKKSV
ncbi:methionyl-tRNA formyltransferase [Candidatus Peribacteria bacterium RIFCSPHIGHO2_01_FULL_51_9]|nr:MAG: methionyl-tRNA formyltransferase [Candidatus Peribacteria bacterium RIFCSPHIGHO2_01_FULL_51_9]